LNISLESVKRITGLLDAAGLGYASGGSGLLYSLGLTQAVRDWDLTTDAPLESVTHALQGVAWISLTSGDYPFASSYRLSIEDPRLPIDIIGRYAIHSEHGLCRLPALAAFQWNGLSMGSPEIWTAAYTLMKRDQKAELFYDYLQEHGADPAVLRLLLAEPLPGPLRTKLLQLVGI
jgi:hypothetical protein